MTQPEPPPHQPSGPQGQPPQGQPPQGQPPQGQVPQGQPPYGQPPQGQAAGAVPSPPGAAPAPGTPGGVPLPRNTVALPEPLAALPPNAWRWIGGLIGTFAATTAAMGLALWVTMKASANSLLQVPGIMENESGLYGEGVPRQLVWLASGGWTGHTGRSFGDGEEWEGSSAVTLPLTIWALLALVVIALVSRALTRKNPPQRRSQLWVQTGIVLAGCFAILLVVGLFARFSTDDEAYRTLSFWGVIRCLLVVGTAILIGAALSVPRGHRIRALFGDKAAATVGPLVPSLDVARGHVLGWSVVGVVATVVTAIVTRDDMPFGTALSWSPFLVPSGATLGHLGGLRWDFGAVVGSQDNLSLFGDVAWYAWLFLLAAIIIVVLLAARLTLLRAPGANVSPAGLAVTAGAVLVAWLLVALVFGMISGSGTGSGSGDRESIFSGPAWWAYLLLALGGVAVELTHGFAGVSLLQMLPTSLLRRLAPAPHAAWAPYLADLAAAKTAAQAQAQAAQAQAQPFPVQGQQPQHPGQAPGHHPGQAPGQHQGRPQQPGQAPGQPGAQAPWQNPGQAQGHQPGTPPTDPPTQPPPPAG